MSLLVVGSVALDSIFTPFGEDRRCAGRIGGVLQRGGLAAPPGAGGRRRRHRLSGGGARGLAPAASTGPASSGPRESFRWKGKYSYDLQSRETLETRLGVFAAFEPKLPAGWRDAKYLFLGNIDPMLQLHVLEQMSRPSLVVCDTMNYWIQSKKPELLKLLERVDILLVNDGEARELSGDWNIHRAGKWIMARGPKRVVIKQGEYGALLIEPDRSFYVPAYPLEEVFDPTGAGAPFAGGFMGYLARVDSTAHAQLRRDGVRGHDGRLRGAGLRGEGFETVDYAAVQIGSRPSWT